MPVTTTIRWQRRFPGSTAHYLWPDAIDNTVYQSSGWGLPFASIRLCKLDAATGSEVASVRLGNQVRALTASSDETSLYAATEHKLFRLDRGTLEVLERWDRGVPKLTDKLLCLGDRIGMSNVGGQFCVFEPATSKAARKKLGAGLQVWLEDGKVLAWSAAEGRARSFDPYTGATKILLTAQPCKAAYSARDRFLILYGPRGEPRYLSGRDFHRIQLVPIEQPGQLREYSCEMVPGVTVIHESSRTLMCVGVSWHPTRHRWLPSSLSIYTLPGLTQLATLPLENGLSGIFLLPELNSVVTVTDDVAEASATYTWVELAGLPRVVGTATKGFETARFFTEWDQLSALLC